jgi:multidrug efflux pump subunit AcrA (membrane-fusion protein)
VEKEKMNSKFALIIANTEYTDPGLAQLTAPGKDAEDFARILKDQDICDFGNVNILLNQTESVVREAIDEFFDQKKSDDLLVLYFSGHGVRDEIGALYLAVKNTNRLRLRSTAIKSDYIREAMDQSRSRRQVLILDCCNSGAFAQGSKAATGVSIGTASAFEGTGYGRVVLTASDSTQFAWEGDRIIGETDNSLFTHFLVKGLEGDADNDGDGRITIDELYDYAYEQIVSITPKQTPGKWSYKQQGEIVLRQISKIENIKPLPLPDELIDEIEDTRPYVRDAAVQKLEKLLRGKNIGLARSAYDALEKIAAEDDSLRVRQAATQTLATTRHELQRAEEERKAREEAEAEHSAIQKAEEERIAREVAQQERIAREKVEAEKVEKERRARQKAEEERIAYERAKAERTAIEAAREKMQQQAAEKNASENQKRQAIAEQKIQPVHEPEIATKASKLSPRLIGGIVGVSLVIALCVCAGLILMNNLPITNLQPTPTSQPTKTHTPSPTQIFSTQTSITTPLTPKPTAASVATATSALKQPSSALEFFKEEFDTSAALDNWDSFTLGTGKGTNLVIRQEDDHVLFDLGAEDLYVYYMYLSHEYGNVSLTMNAENLGRNNNNISLVCRMNSDGTQWYEFSVESGGLWYLYAVNDTYNIVANGGTNSLKQGKEVNEYQLICEGNKITMFVNGNEIKTVTDTKYGFTDGKVGFNISSLNVLPITVEVNWFEIKEP